MALRLVDVSAAYTAPSLPTVAAVRPFCLHKPPAGRLRYSIMYPACNTSSWCSGVPSLCTAGHRTRLGAHVSRPRLVAARALAAPALIASAAGPDPWHTLAVLSTCAAGSQLLEAHTKGGAMLSAPLLALMTALVAAALGLLPPASPIYDAVWCYLMPLAVSLYLLDHDISSLACSGGQVLVSFLLGAGTMVVGAWCAWKLLGTAALGAHGAQLACCLLASYIGGSVNFAAVASATGLPSTLMPAAVAADNLAMLVLLGIMMATSARSITAILSGKQLAMPSTAAAGHRLSPSAALSSQPSSSSSSASRSGPSRAASWLHNARPARPAVGLDGQPLLTQPPDPADLAACMTASAQGRAAVSSSIYKSSGSYKQHALSHRAVGQQTQDRQMLSTPSSTSTAVLGIPTAVAAGVNKPVQVSSRDHSSKGNSSSTDSSVNLSSRSSMLSRKCGGCRASGITALDDNPLLTRAPAMADAITNINAAHVGKQQLRTGPPPGSSRNSPLDQPDDGVVGCGCCEEALNAMAEVSNRGSPFDSRDRGSSSPQRSGALALDGGLLLTDEPSKDEVAAALAAAKAGRKAKSANVSVSGSALSSLASTDSDELELVVKFNWKEFQQNLKREQQLQQQEEEAKKKQRQWQQQAVLPVDWEKISVSSSLDSSSGDSDSESWASNSTTAAAALAAPAAAATAGTQESAIANSGVSLTSSSGAAALAAAAISCAAGQAAATSLGVPALQLLMVSCCAVGLSVAGHVLSRAFSKQQQKTASQPEAPVAGPYAGASHLGQLLMGLFFATLGASCCCSWSSFVAAAPQFVFVIIMVFVHWGLLAVIGKALGAGGLNVVPLSNEVLMVGSAANVGGPATAAALASAKGWQGLVQPALVCGSLGYALGTAGGILLARGLGVLAA